MPRKDSGILLFVKQFELPLQLLPSFLQDHDRWPVLHRDGGAVAGDDGGPHREPQDGEHGVTADQRSALPDAGYLSALDVLLQGVGVTAPIPAPPPGGQHGRLGDGPGTAPG